ncbi:MAG: hypothetical protein A2W27_03960 [Deltaproteobacteria bacterium RBG_16_44_11]|nr:MAG: hypothetical protein A2W27_03960 [Deltaproteobacteria bacterium RBG_16_44_11]
MRCKPCRSTYIFIRFAVRFLRALHLTIFKKPQNMALFNYPTGSDSKLKFLMILYQDHLRRY